MILKHCGFEFIVNGTHLKQNNVIILIEENIFEMVVTEVGAILSCAQCVVHSSPPSAAYMRQSNRVSIGSDNGLSPIRPVLGYCKLDP